ncbi:MULTISPECIES: hypothetical protein [unclassified Pseudoalteromonas]|uniref:PKD domain-containing protein n=1 Tax=unclassified Pseudoalteromonas TaxID=194690 RepID=UPI0025B2B31F|nr:MULTISPECIES: hypothetical protein [unclassified Pseudoalteromonas]MDN3378546.1 hypothetical protein [Pseudoalteromonas sp. APC 3893]MDN3387041.1 hypothetical protein [Pseudoalteromonas sp. APC 4017]
MSSSNKIKSLGASALLISSLHLAGCGGGGDGDDNTTPPVSNNNSPTVSISGETEVTEGNELAISATASDSDGSISSYAWQHVSGPDVILTGSDTANISFTAPELEDDAQLVLEVIVTDNEGATTSAQVTIELKRKVLTVTITGIVTDEPIKESNVAVLVGDETFDVTADGDGKYSVEIEVDDSFANKLVRLVALGNTAINPEVEFISQLKSVATLMNQAGEDGELTKEENFGVNITNVSTSEFALIKRDNGEIADEQALDNALLAVDADEKLLLAALIKIIVDEDNYELPEGVESTLDLISNADDIDNFINTVESQDPDLIEATKETIKEDDELVDTTVSDVTGDYILMMPQYYRANVGQLAFQSEGKGYVSFINVDASFTWQQNEQEVMITLDEPAAVNCSYQVHNDEQQENCNYLVDLGMTILLENDANRTVELYSKYEDRWTETQEVSNTSESTSNFSLIDKQKTITVAAGDLIGTWLMDGGSDFYGFSNAVSFDLSAGGTGTLKDNDKDPVDITWLVDGNRLVITSSVETVPFDYEIWLIKDVKVGYQFTASLNAKSDNATRTSTGLLIKDNNLAFTTDELLGKWTIFLGYNSPQTDLHYDVYDDGLMNFNLNQNYRSWQVSSEGDFLRYNYFTNNGIQPICPEDEECQVYSEFSQRLLASSNEQYFTYRKYRFFNTDGSERVDDYSSHLRNFAVSDNYGVTRFAPYWIQENPGFDADGYPTNVSYIELYTPKKQGVETVKIATNYNDETEQSEYQITFSYLGSATSNSYSLVSGKLLFADMQVEVIDFERNFITVCIYAQGGACNEADEQRWYFDEAMAADNITQERPETTHPLDGAWQIADEPDVVVVIRDGKWVHVQSEADADVDDAFPGFEIGDFTWNEETGEFVVTLTEDTNGSFGLDEDETILASVEGDTLTLNINGEGNFVLTRIYDSSNPLVGAYFDGSIADDDFFLVVFKEDGTFIELDHESGYEPGITGSMYTVESDESGDPSTLAVTVDYYINQLDSLADQDPYFVVQPSGNKIIWHDGDDFGVMQRVTEVSSNELLFTEADVLGQHILRYLTDDGTGQVDLVVDIMTDDARFEINGELRVVEWSIELGQLKLYSPLELEGDSAYGVIISPEAIINEDEGFAVSVFGFEAPDNHPDKEDPELYISVMGSMLKQ